MLHAFFLMCVATTACASGPEKAPLPIWDGSYAEHLDSIPGHQTTFLSPDLSELVLVLKDTGKRNFVKAVSLNKHIRPAVGVTISRPNESEYQYTYSLSNGVAARDAILRFEIVVPASFDSPFALIDGKVGPKEWSGGVSYPVIARQCELDGAASGRYAHWVGTSGMTYKLDPGKTRTGLGLRTSFRPGFTTAYVGGNFVWTPEDWDVDVQILSDPVWTMVHLPVVGPMFDNSASCADVLSNYHRGLTRILQCASPNLEKTTLSRLLAKVDQGSSNCGALAAKLRQETVVGNGKLIEIQSALQLALEPFLNRQEKDKR